MLVGTIIGNVWATRKHDGLAAAKLMVVAPHQFAGSPPGYPVVAVDLIGAGIGETVLVATGSAARLSAGSESGPIDHAIVGIVDMLDLPD